MANILGRHDQLPLANNQKLQGLKETVMLQVLATTLFNLLDDGENLLVDLGIDSLEFDAPATRKFDVDDRSHDFEKGCPSGIGDGHCVERQCLHF